MRSTIASAAGVAVGIWIMFAPAVLGYSGSAATNDRIVGPTAAAAAWIAGTQVTRSMRWVNVGFGFWLVAAPLVLDYSGADVLHPVLSGIGVVASALAIGAIPTQRYGGGWRILVQRSQSSRAGSDDR